MSHQNGKTIGTLIKEKYSTLLKSSNISLLGHLPSNNTQQQIANAFILVVPSLYDNYPYTVLEGMSKGLILLVSKQGGHSEIINDGVNGFIFDHQIEGDMAKKMQTALNLSPEEAVVISDNARETIDLLDLEHVTARKIDLIHNKNKESQVSKNKYPFNQKRLFANSKIDIAGNEGSNNILSIVIPYYNLGYLLKETISSVMDSSYQQKEIIIINDSSTDQESIACLKEIENWKDPSIRIIHKQLNEGLSLARNLGASLATGFFLAFLDGDDMVDKLYYTKAIDILRKYDNVHFVGSWVKYFGDKADTWPSFCPEPPYILYHNMVNSSSLVYKRNSFIHGGLNDKDLIFGMEDYESVVRTNCIWFWWCSYS